MTTLNTAARAIRGPLAAAGLLLAVMVVALRVEGRRRWCAGGELCPWSWDVWSSHCSQHLIDPYTISHVCHGLIFFAILHFAARKLPMSWRLVAAVTVAAGWEMLENSSMVIERYRATTMSLDYLGDSVINSLGDVGACALGFVVAERIGWRWGLALFVALDLISLWWIRDNLTLNVVMLLWPIDAIRHWQSSGQMPAVPGVN